MLDVDGSVRSHRRIQPYPNMTIRTALHRFGQPMEVVEIEKSLESYQAIVGGYVESVKIGDRPGMVFLVNEDGKDIGEGSRQPSFYRDDSESQSGFERYEQRQLLFLSGSHQVGTH